jgi:peptidoglycan/LPS O-acetylase OafA/YrhL
MAVAGLVVAALVPVTGTRFMRNTGLMTYPLYLIHDVGCAILRIGPLVGKYAALLVAVAVVITMAWMVTAADPGSAFHL